MEKKEIIDPENMTAEMEQSAQTQNREQEHHHSHSHHHSHRHSRKKGNRKLKKFYQKHKKWIRPVALLLAIFLIAIGLMTAAELITKARNEEYAQQSGHTVEGIAMLAVSVFDAPQSLVNDATNTIMTSHALTDPAHVILEKHWSDEIRLDTCVPVQLTCYVSKAPANYEIQSSRVLVSEDPRLDNAQEYILEANQKTLKLQNLKPDHSYYYQVTVTFTNQVSTSVTGSFQTKASPRILNVSGIRNVRDIGGIKTTDGKTIRQGLLIRGTELDGAVEPALRITEEGCATMLKELGIRTDMDLRGSSEVANFVNLLGNSVEHDFYSAPMYTDIFLEDNKESVRRIFSKLADPQIYPVYMHCTYGLDRTGTICCLLEALLGADEDAVRRDYLLSGLFRKYLTEISFNSLLSSLQQYEGDTLQAKTENYLLSIGVTEEEIASIRHIFLD